MSSPILFLSHSGMDSDAALALADRIESSPEAARRGLKVWIDKRSLLAGTPWQDQLEQAIAKGSTAFGVYLTNAGAENWVRLEVRAALQRVIDDQRVGRSYPFVPIVAGDLTDIRRLPLFAQQYHGVSLSEGSAAIEKLVSVVLAHDATHLPLVRAPFRGLADFGAEDAHLFFGREEDTRRIIELLKRQTFVLVVGDSGSGKSSVVKAGVATAFKEGELADPREPRPAAGLWHVIQMRPTSNPVEGLIRAVLDAARGLDVDEKLLGNAVTRLRDRPGVAATRGGTSPEWLGAFRDVLREGSPASAHVLLVVDQFEELWTLNRDEVLRAAFLDGLLDEGASTLRVIGTMRRDYLFQCDSHPGLRERLKAATGRCLYNLRRMGDANLRRCIVGPLALAGVDEEEARQLADEILRDAGDQPGDLALIEMALFETWEKRHRYANLLDAYRKLGRVEGALPAAAEEAFAALGDDRAVLAEAVFMRLVSRSSTGGVSRRPARKREFFTDRWEVAQALASPEFNRLLVLGRDAREEEETAELAHEQLVTQWPRYQAWLRDSEEEKRTLDRLIERVQRWSRHGRPLAGLAAGFDLKEFRHLQHRRPLWLAPDDVSFVRRSQVKRTLLGVAAMAFMVALLLGARWVYVDQRRQLVEAKASGLWIQLQLGDADVFTPRDRRTPSAFAGVAPDVRLKFLEMLRTDGAVAARFLRSPDLITRTAVGLDVNLRRRVLAQVVVPPLAPDQDQLIHAAVAVLGCELQSIEGIAVAVNAFGRSTGQLPEQVRDALASLLPKLTPDEAARALEQMLTALLAANNEDEVVWFSRELASLSRKVPENRAQAAADGLLRLAAASKHPRTMTAAFAAVSALSVRLPAPQVEGAMAPALSGLSGGDYDFALALQALSNKMDDGQRLEALKAVRTAAALPDNQNSPAFGRVFAVLCEQLNGPSAEQMLGLSLQDIHLAGSRNESFPGLVRGLAAVGRASRPEEAAKAVGPLVEAIRTWAEGSTASTLGNALRAISQGLTIEHALGAFELLAPAAEATDDPKKVVALGKGIGPIAPKLTEDKVRRAIPLLLKSMDAAQYTDLAELAQDLGALTGKMTADQAAQAMVLMTRAVAASTPIAAFGGGGYGDSYAFLNELHAGLKTFAQSMTAEQASLGFEPALKILSVSVDERRVTALADGVVALCGKLSSNRASGAVDSILVTVTDKDAFWRIALSGGGRDGDPTFHVLGDALVACASRMTSGEAQLIERLLTLMTKATDVKELATLSRGVGVFSARLSGDQVSRMFELLAKPMPGRAESLSDLYDVAWLSQGLEPISARLTSEQAGRALRPIGEALPRLDSAVQVSALGDLFASLASQLSGEMALVELDRILALGPWVSPALDRGIGILTSKLTEKQTAELVERTLQTILTEQSPEGVASLYRELRTLPVQISAAQEAKVTERVLSLMSSPTLYDPDLRFLAQGLKSLHVTFTGNQIATVLEPFVKAAVASASAAELTIVGEGLSTLFATIKDPVPVGVAVREVLKNPLSVGETSDHLLEEFHKTYPAVTTDATLWSFAAWVGERD